MSVPTFLARIESGDVLVSDGATGTNLFARGLPRGVTAEDWIFENPAEIVRLHRDFVEAGSDIILTNTFGATQLRLESTDLKGRVQELNQRAVELARQAIEEANAGDRPVYIGGSIGPSGALLKPYGPLEEDQMYASFLAQAGALVGAGVDLVVVETQFDLNEAMLAVKAAREQSSDLPLVISFSYDSGTRSMMGVSPSKMAAEFTSEALGIDILGVNCGRSLDENLEALKELRQATEKPIWFKPNAGVPQRDAHGNTVFDISPEEMGALVPAWIAAGASVIGGCCGTSPEHLAEIAAARG